MTVPLVSVVIPAFNASKHVHAAIESCLGQTLTNIEILVVDDGSVDATAAIVRRYAGDPRMKLIELATNRGVSGARNVAINHATGTWIATLDADDTMTDERLEVLVAAAERTGADLLHDDLLLVHDGETVPYATLSASTGYRVDPLTMVDLDRLIDCEIGGRSSYRLGLTRPIIRRSFLESNRIRYDPSLRVGEDYLLYLECLLAGAAWFQHPDAHYRYVQRPGSATSQPQVPTLEAKLRVCTNLLSRPSLESSSRSSLMRYQRNLESLLAYQRVAEPAKARHLGAALGAVLRNPRFFQRVGTELPGVARRRWAYHVRHDQHAFDMLPVR